MSSPATSPPVGSPLSPRATYLRSASSSFTSPGASSSSGGSTPSRPPSAIFVGNSSAAYTAAMAGETEKAQDKTISRAARGADRSSSFRAAVGAGGLPSPPATNSDATSSAGKAAGKTALEQGTSGRNTSRRRPTTSSLNSGGDQENEPTRRPSLSSRHRLSTSRRIERNGSSSPAVASPPTDTPVDPSPERAAAHKSALMTLTSSHTPSRLTDKTQRQGSSSSESTPRRPTPSAGNGRSPGTESLRKLLSRPATVNPVSPGSPLNSVGQSASRHQHTASSPSALSPGDQERPSTSSADRRQSRASFDRLNASPSPATYETHSKRRPPTGTASDEISPTKDTIRRSHTISHDLSPRLASSFKPAESEEMAQAKERVGTWMSGQGDDGDDSRFDSGGSGSKRKPLPQDFRNGSLFTPSPRSSDFRRDQGTSAHTPSRHTTSEYNSPRRSATLVSRWQDYSSPSTPYTPSGLSRVRNHERQSVIEHPRDADDGSAFARRTWHDTISGLPRSRDRPESVLEGTAAYRYQARGGSAESGLTTERLAERDRLRPVSTVGMTPSPNRSRLSHLDSVSQRHGQSEAGGSSDPLEVLARLEQAREESQRKRALLLQDRPQSVLDSPRARDRFDSQRYEPRPSSRTTWTPVADRQPLRSATSMSFVRDKAPRTAPAAHRTRHIDGMPDSPSVGRGASRAFYSSSVAGSRSDTQAPRAMRSNSSLGSRAGQIPSTSATEHGRLLLDACRAMESRIGQGSSGLSDLLRSSHTAARTSEASNTLLREALAMATQAQIQIEVEGTDARDVVAKLTATLREATKASDENIRSLTGVILCLPKVLRESSVAGPRRSGSFETDSVNGHGSSGRSSARHVRTPADFSKNSMDVETRSATSNGDRSTYSRRSVDQESPRRSGSLLSFTSRKLFPGANKSPTQNPSPRVPLPSIPSSRDFDTMSSPSQASPSKSTSSFLRKRPSALTVKGASNSSFFPAIRGSAPTTAISQVTVGDAASSPSQSSFVTSPRPPLDSVGSDQDDTVSMLERKLAASEAKQAAGSSVGQRDSVDSKSSSGKAARFWRRASKGE